MKRLTIFLAIAIGACQTHQPPDTLSSGDELAVHEVAATGETTGAASGAANDPALLNQ